MLNKCAFYVILGAKKMAAKIKTQKQKNHKQNQRLANELSRINQLTQAAEYGIFNY